MLGKPGIGGGMMMVECTGPRRPGPLFDSRAALPRTPARGEPIFPGSGFEYEDKNHHAGAGLPRTPPLFGGTDSQ